MNPRALRDASMTLAVLVLGWSLAGCGERDQASTAAGASAADLERGRRVYAMMCAACHGDEGRGDGRGAVAARARPRDLTTEPYRLIAPIEGGRTEAEAVAAYIRVGSPAAGMPPFQGLPSEDLAALAAFVVSLRPQPAYFQPEDGTDPGAGEG